MRFRIESSRSMATVAAIVFVAVAMLATITLQGPILRTFGRRHHVVKMSLRGEVGMGK